MILKPEFLIRRASTSLFLRLRLGSGSIIKGRTIVIVLARFLTKVLASGTTLVQKGDSVTITGYNGQRHVKRSRGGSHRAVVITWRPKGLQGL